MGLPPSAGIDTTGDAEAHSACLAWCCRLITVCVGQFLQFLTERTDGVLTIHLSRIHFDKLEALFTMNRQDIDQIALRLVSLVPPGLAQAQQDLRANFQDVLAQGLRRLDLVTREEFEVQTQVLARTRAKVDELERRVAELEAAVAARGG
jgi:ubiquinone biosynthesis accessory factor UbiK